MGLPSAALTEAASVGGLTFLSFKFLKQIALLRDMRSEVPVEVPHECRPIGRYAHKSGHHRDVFRWTNLKAGYGTAWFQRSGMGGRQLWETIMTRTIVVLSIALSMAVASATPTLARGVEAGGSGQRQDAATACKGGAPESQRVAQYGGYGGP
jgi:hypothetical protein